MIQDIKIDVHHLTRVEGHGNIVVDVKNGKVEKCEWQVPEAPRFFESMVRGRHYTEVARVTSRICGICSIGHTLASLKATEAACAVEISHQTGRLRRLLKHAENFDSHVLHVFVLAAPDLAGAPSVLPLIKTHPAVVAGALKLKRLGHEWGSLIGGRTTHPTSAVPGGFTSVPTEDELQTLRGRLLKAAADLEPLLEVVAALAKNIPSFYRPTEYIALHSDVDYSLYNGDIQSFVDGRPKERLPVSEYRRVTNEYVVPQSTAKYTRNRLPCYAVGALARFNNNHEQLHHEAKRVAQALGLLPHCFNPYMNTAAQAVEMVHNLHKSIQIIDELLAEGVSLEKPAAPTRFGKGSGAVEVPRGILFHEYEYDKEGICVSGNCIIPTNQNHGNIQADFEKLVPELLEAGKGEKQMELALEMLVRAYDPCISCSTHYLDVTFKR
ncbi:MAG: Ni/Fe hydrogenase subunit alpha [Elusimicrobia bacterium]|nr:Ni/Fe hydrogenase subunit alpha [Elusimicrobiota bacterium]